jgi:hypothetical protein
MFSYGATTWSNQLNGSSNIHSVTVDIDGRRHIFPGEEINRLLGSVADVPVNDTYSIRAVRHVRQHRKLYNALWLAILIITLATVLGLYYHEKNKTNPPICESDRSYPAAIFLSIFLGIFG